MKPETALFLEKSHELLERADTMMKGLRWVTVGYGDSLRDINARVPGRNKINCHRNFAQLTKAGCKKVFREVASGAKTDRAQLRRLLDQLEAGDVLTVTRLDPLARSTRDLLNTLAAISGKKAGFKSLGDTCADTTTSHGRLVLTVLGGLAESERDLIRPRTGEGRARAVARGQRMGRPPKLTPHQQKEAIKRREQGDTLAEIGRSYNVRPATISRLATGGE